MRVRHISTKLREASARRSFCSFVDERGTNFARARTPFFSRERRAECSGRFLRRRSVPPTTFQPWFADYETAGRARVRRHSHRQFKLKGAPLARIVFHQRMSTGSRTARTPPGNLVSALTIITIRGFQQSERCRTAFSQLGTEFDCGTSRPSRKLWRSDENASTSNGRSRRPPNEVTALKSQP